MLMSWMTFSQYIMVDRSYLYEGHVFHVLKHRCVLQGRKLNIVAGTESHKEEVEDYFVHV